MSIPCSWTDKDSKIYTPRFMYILVKISSQPFMWKVTSRSMNVVIFVILLNVLIIGEFWKNIIFRP